MVGRLMGLYFVHLFDDFVGYARIPRYVGLVGLCALSDVFAGGTAGEEKGR